MKKKVSCHIITYNQKEYISNCIDSILMQKTNFSVEIIIGDDNSNDGTREILKDYAFKYPDLIKLNLREVRGLGLPGKQNFLTTLEMCVGKYIALCEGDDYWTDPLKLQKQVDFLETNPEYGICFHNVMQLNTFDTSKNCVIPNVTSDFDYNLEDYILNNKTATCSIVFKKEYLKSIPNWFMKVSFGDLALILHLMYNSNQLGHVLKDVMGVYRIHEGGVHGSFHDSNKSLINAYLLHIQFTKIISNDFLVEKKYQKIIFKKILNTYKILENLYDKDGDKLNTMKTNIFIKYYMFKLKFI